MTPTPGTLCSLCRAGGQAYRTGPGLWRHGLYVCLASQLHESCYSTDAGHVVTPGDWPEGEVWPTDAELAECQGAEEARDAYYDDALPADVLVSPDDEDDEEL